MRRRHFEAYRPICPVCAAQGAAHALAIAAIWRERGDEIEAGSLACAACATAYPIVDFLPVLVPDPRRFLGEQLAYLAMREDLPGEVETWLGDAAGAGSWYDTMRQHQSGYGFDHWDGGESSALACLQAGLAQLPAAPAGGLALDLGCGPGRSSFALAEAGAELVLGIDVNVALLRLARQALHGTVRFPLRRAGLAYETRTRATGLDPALSPRVDFWIADALALPFANGTASLVAALNVIDCLRAPAAGLGAIGRVLDGSGHAIVATPYDWSSAVTPPEQWLGGHPGTTADGDGAAALRAAVEADPGLQLVAEIADLPWRVRLHDRAEMRYRAHLALLGSNGAKPMV